MKVGDRLAIGKATFTIRGVITTEPGRSMGNFSLGPRVLIDLADVGSTGLVSFGSQVRRVILVRAPENRVEALVRGLRDEFKDEFVTARSFRATDDAIGEDFERAENYLSMVGLVIVILGGIAVSSVTRVFILQKFRSIAVLKCVGARSAQIIAVYLLQVLALGLAGSLLGVVLARRGHRRDPAVSAAGHASARRRPLRRHARARRPRASASARWCRCCSRSSRCFRSASSGRRCCSATKLGRTRHRLGRAGRQWCW